MAFWLLWAFRVNKIYKFFQLGENYNINISRLSLSEIITLSIITEDVTKGNDEEYK